MEGSMKDLAKYRLERAEEMLRASQINLRLGEFRTSMNRSYYAVFHAMRAANSLYSFDSTKHSGVISFFRRTFLKDGLIDKSLSKIITKTSFYRESSDYQDFFLASRADAETQLENAKRFVTVVSEFLAEYLDSGQ